MTTYPTTISISGENPAAKQALLGEEADHLRRLHQEGILPVASLTVDATTAWLVLEATDEDEVAQIVDRFSLARWFQKTSVEPVLLLQPENGP